MQPPAGQPDLKLRSLGLPYGLIAQQFLPGALVSEHGCEAKGNSLGHREIVSRVLHLKRDPVVGHG